MDPENCYICNATSVFYSRSLFKTKSKYSKTRICEFVRKFLGDYPSERECVAVNGSENEHCVCIECLNKIDEYDLAIMTAKRVERELRDILLHTEALFFSQSKSVKTEQLFLHSIEPVETSPRSRDEGSDGNECVEMETLPSESESIKSEIDSDEDYVPAKTKKLPTKKSKVEQTAPSKKLERNHKCLKCNMEFERFVYRGNAKGHIKITQYFSIDCNDSVLFSISVLLP